MSGNVSGEDGVVMVISTDLTNTTWHVSGCSFVSILAKRQRMQRLLYLHAIEDLAIPRLLPLAGHFAISKLDQNHVSVCSSSSYHPEMADLISGLFSNESQKVRRG
jgi:hypothetical protein